ALTAKTLGEHVERDIGHAARDVVRVRALEGSAHDIDDDAAAARAHPRVDDPGQVDITEDLQIPRLAPGCRVDHCQRAGWNVAGIVHKDVDVLTGFAERLDLRCQREVTTIDGNLDAMLLR